MKAAVVEQVAAVATIAHACGASAAVAMERVAVATAVSEQGPSGPPGQSFAPVTVTRSTPAGTWIIPHSLGRRPIVAVYVGDEEVIADVAATASIVTITFAQAQAGTAILF